MGDFVTIGRTNYYTARKGPHNYRVAEGRRLTDTEHAWMVLKDDESGKNYFVNGDGVRRWHLPDIFQTEEERELELKELKFKRDRRLARERGNKAGGEEGEEKKSDAEAAAEKSEKDKKADAAAEDADFGARDRAAAALRPQKFWESNADQRRAVIKFVKGHLAPLSAQGDLDSALFQTVSTTVCREFFAGHSDFSEAAKTKLRADALAYAKARIDEKTIKEEYRKMNAELLAKVKRLDAERKQLNQKIADYIKLEEANKDEIFKLRAHKSDAVLQSFKRLTRQGLTQTYWHRWKAFKATRDAQMHVRAREAKTSALVEKNQQLDQSLKEALAQNKSLNDRVRRSEGRDVINVMLRQSGVYVLSRFYYIWKRWSEASVKEKQFHALRLQLDDCPRCIESKVENQRLKWRLGEAFKVFASKETEFWEMKESKERAERHSDAVNALVVNLQQSVKGAQDCAAELSKKLATTERRLFEAERRGRDLEAKIEELQFEIMNLSDFSGKGAAGGGGAGGGDGAVKFSGLAGDGTQLGRSLTNPLLNAEGHLGHFMTNEHINLEARLRDITVGRAAANAERAARILKTIDEGEPGSGIVGLSAAGTTTRPDTHTRGTINPHMSHAIAPQVVGPPPLDARRGGVSPPNSARRRRGGGDNDSPPPPSDAPPDDLIYRETLADDDDGDISPPPPPGDDSDDDARGTLNELRAAEIERQKEAEEKENEKCEKCNFRKKLTPFCPKDGTRHFFTSLMMEPLVKAKIPLTAEEFTLSLRQTKEQQEAARLPPGLPPGAIEGRAILRPNSLAAQLRASLNLNPGQFDPRSLQPVRHTNAMEIIRDPAEQKSIDDYIRTTKGRAEAARLQALEGRVDGGLGQKQNESFMMALRYNKERDGHPSSSSSGGRPSHWHNVFGQTIEGMEGSMRDDPVFGVAHTSAKQPSAAEVLLNTHTARPNFVRQ